MNPRLDLLHPYPFERLRRLHEGHRTPEGVRPINLGIGEPQHPTPAIIKDALVANFAQLNRYPPTGGSPELRKAISDWNYRRYEITVDPGTEIIPVAGTREALYAFAQAVLDPEDPGVVLLPNPFYQIYEGAALMAGARPVYVPTPRENGYLPDWSAVPEHVWPHVRLAYVCTPGNPAGAVMGQAEWEEILSLADRYGFVVAADECYSEIYNGEPPVGGLQASTDLGRGFRNVVAFNSLSKRSSAPGLRSGFVAGDPEVLAKFLLYRTYHGAAPSSLTQAASVPAWADETHVKENRAKYRAKFDLARRILPGATIPAGGFFLWLPVEDDEAFSLRAFTEAGLTVLPGRYLAREVDGQDPGAGHIRAALVADMDVIEEALVRLQKLL
ncbi:MAG: succinyldiaminopimelate transaminase [Fimbriimonas sp.]